MQGAAENFRRRFEKKRMDLVERGVAALAEATEAGALALDAALEDAVTKTGYYRMLIQGGRPGRHETGNMVSKIRTNAAAPDHDFNRTTMAFGWFAGDFEAYFREQDQGAPPVGGNRTGIPAAEALYDMDGKPGEAPQIAVKALRAAMARAFR